MSEVEKMNSSSGAESADQPCGLTETQHFAGEAFYLAMYEGDGGKWEAVDERHRPLWEAKGKRFFDLMAAGAQEPSGETTPRVDFWRTRAIALEARAAFPDRAEIGVSATLRERIAGIIARAHGGDEEWADPCSEEAADDVVKELLNGGPDYPFANVWPTKNPFDVGIQWTVAFRAANLVECKTEADARAYAAKHAYYVIDGPPQYDPPHSAEMSASSPSEASAGNPATDELLQSQARRVEELEGALRGIADLSSPLTWADMEKRLTEINYLSRSALQSRDAHPPSGVTAPDGEVGGGHD